MTLFFSLRYPVRLLFINSFFTFISDTEDLYEIGFKKVASRYGKEFTFALKCKIMGQQSREFAKYIIDELGLPLTIDEFLAELRAVLDELFPQSEILPGKV